MKAKATPQAERESRRMAETTETYLTEAEKERDLALKKLIAVKQSLAACENN